MVTQEIEPTKGLRSNWRSMIATLLNIIEGKGNKARSTWFFIRHVDELQFYTNFSWLIYSSFEGSYTWNCHHISYTHWLTNGPCCYSVVKQNSCLEVYCKFEKSLNLKLANWVRTRRPPRPATPLQCSSDNNGFRLFEFIHWGCFNLSKCL